MNNLNFEYKATGDISKIKNKKVLGVFTTRHCTSYSKKIIKEIINNFQDTYCFMMTYETFNRLDLGRLDSSIILIFEDSQLSNTKKDKNIKVFLKCDVSELRLKYLFKDLFISSKSDNVLILEATRYSKNLNILALFAQELGKEVFVLPGRIDSNSSEGTNRLIFDGASPFYSLDLLKI